MQHGTRSAVAPSLAAVICLVSSPAQAQQPFDWEVGAEYVDRTLEFSDAFFGDEEIDVNGFGLSAQWFLAPVDSTSGPLERAPFLVRASSLSFALAQIDIDDAGVDSEADALAVAGRFQFDNDWFVTGAVSETDNETDGLSTEFREFGLGVGLYVAENTAVAFNVTREDIDFGSGGSEDITSYGIDFEHVSELSASAWQLALDGSLLVPDGEFDEMRISAGVTLYPSRYLGFGADLSAALDDTGDRPQTFGIFGRWFVTDAWSVSARYDWTDFNPGFGEQEDEGFLLDARFRF